MYLFVSTLKVNLNLAECEENVVLQSQWKVANNDIILLNNSLRNSNRKYHTEIVRLLSLSSRCSAFKKLSTQSNDALSTFCANSVAKDDDVSELSHFEEKKTPPTTPMFQIASFQTVDVAPSNGIDAKTKSKKQQTLLENLRKAQQVVVTDLSGSLFKDHNDENCDPSVPRPAPSIETFAASIDAKNKDSAEVSVDGLSMLEAPATFVKPTNETHVSDVTPRTLTTTRPDLESSVAFTKLTKNQRVVVKMAALTSGASDRPVDHMGIDSFVGVVKFKSLEFIALKVEVLGGWLRLTPAQCAEHVCTMTQHKEKQRSVTDGSDEIAGAVHMTSDSWRELQRASPEVFQQLKDLFQQLKDLFESYEAHMTSSVVEPEVVMGNKTERTPTSQDVHTVAFRSPLSTPEGDDHALQPLNVHTLQPLAKPANGTSAPVVPIVVKSVRQKRSTANSRKTLPQSVPGPLSPSVQRQGQRQLVAPSAVTSVSANLFGSSSPLSRALSTSSSSLNALRENNKRVSVGTSVELLFEAMVRRYYQVEMNESRHKRRKQEVTTLLTDPTRRHTYPRYLKYFPYTVLDEDEDEDE